LSTPSTTETTDEKQPPRARASHRWPVLIIVAIAAILRVGALAVTRDAEPVKDEKTYLQRGEALLDGEGYVGSYQSWFRHHEVVNMADLPQYPGAFQPPGYPTFVALMMAISDRSVLAVKLGQVVLSTLTVLLVYLLGRAWLGAGRGLLAAALCAVYPNLIAFSHLLWSETLYIIVFLIPVYLLTRSRALPGRTACIVAGVFLGLAALTRGSMVYFLPPVLGWFALVHRQDLRPALGRCGLILATVALLVAPWTIRNYSVHDGFVLIDTNGPYNLWRGNNPESYQLRMEPRPPRSRLPGDRMMVPQPFEQSYDPPFDSIPIAPVGALGGRTLVKSVRQDLQIKRPTDLQIARWASDKAWSHIFEDPAGFLQRGKYKLIDMWNPTSFLIRHFHQEIRGYGVVDQKTRRRLTWAAAGSYLLVMVLAGVGILGALRNRYLWLTLLLVALQTGISFLAFGLTRFRLPLMPFLFVFAAQGVYMMWRPFFGRSADPSSP
jgi:hypothetical protein